MQEKIIEICFPDKYQVEFQSRPKTLPEKSILVKNFFSLISPGTELAFYTGTHIGLKDPKNSWASFPFFPGYASIGIVEQADGMMNSFLGKTMIHCVSILSFYMGIPLTTVQISWNILNYFKKGEKK